MPLEEYHKKRDFKVTSEPEGKEKESTAKLRFVIQRHAATRLHYDFRLEMEGVLKSWAVPKGPSLNPSDKRLAMMVEDHPYEYRTFEGSIPKGNYGAGEVEIWDEGTYEPLEKIDGKSDDLVMRSELHKQSLKFILHGKKLKGEFALVKIKNSTEENAWLLIKHKDRYAVAEDYDAEEQTPKNSKVTAYLQEKSSKKKNNTAESLKHYKNYASALSGEKKLPDFIRPMLCKTSEKPFDNKDWAFEIKWDGYRAIADIRDGEIRLYSRNGLDFSKSFRKVSDALKIQNHEMVLDGEVVAYDDKGKPNFQWLQRIAEQNTDLVLIYQVFDLLWLNGHSTENLSYLQRKELLKEALIENDIIKYHDHILQNGKDFFQAAENMGLEGIIAKKADSEYKENIRSSEWLKIKIHQSDEAVICGFTAPKGARKHFGSLILGKYLNGELIFCGHTGTGFTEQSLKEIHQKLQPLVVKESAFKITPKTNSKATWLKPELVAEIKYTELTKDHIYRHPVFLRLREDIDDTDVKFDTNSPQKQPEMKAKATSKKTTTTDIVKKIGKQQVTLTNQNKLYFPADGITKGDIIEYYQSISKFILPHLKNRPQSLNRFPNGIEGLSFYQKDADEHTPGWVTLQKIFSESNDKYINYIICNDKETLAYLNNLGCIELNIWTSHTPKVDFPDYLVLDLDPSEKNTFEDVIETALAVKEVLDKAGIIGYPKTSGSSGIHVYIPMGAKYTYDQVKDFGHVLMQLVHQELPELTTLERSLQKRDKNKIYLDYLQNRRAQTLASVYSVRPKPGAPVSTPLEWNEVKKGLHPTNFTIHNMAERLQEKGDLFKSILGKGIDLLKAINRLGNI
ncbi:DNA ligase D [Chryseobacterium sp. ES2]|uniref:DNA ligase (ATP) n=1 Tax=Chryseobacterium metallicongregator TaxID=3073042 RepID=A0ABU1E721_9FLAO|nr:DNA ligase D [Chryseobacterium sp. ES2]MDR4953614.1 DNA ligase D [Chryseobacterium sp. ES2]